MSRIWYCLTLESDVSFSASNSSVQARTLTYVPGAALLGAAAKALYPKDDDSRAYTLFHSGAVRFGNALPVGRDGSPTVPAPKVYYVAKRKGQGDDLEKAGATINAVRHSPTTQPDPVKSGYLQANAEIATPDRRIALRTAIDRETGRAADSKLYQMECLREGQSFIGYIDGQEADIRTLWTALGGRVRVGRSRGVELGTATVTEIKDPSSFPMGQAVNFPMGQAVNSATFHCLSDLALVDAQGLPRLVPEPADFGLTGLTFDPGRSVLRTRSYSPYNGHRRRFDLERQVIEAGSVLHFTGGTPDVNAVSTAIAEGVGLHAAEGLGVVVFEPEYLHGSKLVAWTPWLTCVNQPAISTADQTPLMAWLTEKHQATLNERGLFDTAAVLAKRFADVPPSQWGALPALVGADGKTEALKSFLSKGVRKRRWEYRQGDLLKALDNVQDGERKYFLTLFGAHARKAAADHQNKGKGEGQ